jgi:regulator of sigma E protease
MIQSTTSDSIAARAGLTANQEIINVNEVPINSWQSFQYAMMPFIGSKDTLVIRLKSLKNGVESQVSLPLIDWKLNDKNPDLLKSLGIEPFIPSIPPIVGEIVPDSPAAKSQLQKGDFLLHVNGQHIKDWLYLVNYVKAHPDTSLTLEFKRKGHQQQIALFSGHQNNQGKVEGFLGLKSEKVDWPNNWLRLEKKAPLEALGVAFRQTFKLTGTTFILMGRLVTGQLGLKTISGPLGIAQGAGNSGRNGLVSYLFFLALVSISLGVLNLLPIPLLDGGHLLYYAVEFIRGKPLSEAAKSIGIYFGLLLLAALMGIALTNDISRL